MSKSVSSIGGFILAFAFTSFLGAQTASPQTTPAPSTDDIVAASASDSNAEEADKPFKPSWKKEFCFSHSNQQAGQNTNTLSFTGTYNFNEGGDFLGASLEYSRQKVEGSDTNSGVMGAQGGLGLDFFTPSLSLSYQYGENALKVASGTLSLPFQLWDPFSISLSFGGSAGNHQGSLSQFFGSSDALVQIDTASWNTSLELTYQAWDWLLLTLTTENEYDITYQIQSINHKTKLPLNQSDQIASLTLGLNFNLTKEWVLGVSGEGGKEYSPAGSVYSPLSGGIVDFSTPTTQNFAAGTVSITYSFE